MAEPEPQPTQEKVENPSQTSNNFLHQLGEKYDKFIIAPLLSKPVTVLALALSATVAGISIYEGSLEKSIIFG